MIEAFKLVGTIVLEGAEKVGSGLKDVQAKVVDTEKGMEKLGGNLEKAGKNITNFGKGTMAVGGNLTKWVTAPILGVGTALFGMASQTAQTADRIDKMSQRLGMSRSSFQEWDFILSQSGSSIDGLQTGMKTLAQRMNEAINGTGKGAEAFERLGVTITESMTQEEAFEEVIRGFQGMEDGIDKADLAQKIFGRTGQELLPLLNGARGSLDELKDTYEALGLEISNETIDAGVKFTDTMDQLKRTGQTLGAEVGGAVLPIFQRFAEWMISDGIPKIKGFGDRVKVLIDWFKDLSPATQDTIIKFALLLAGIGPILVAVGGFIAVFGGMITQIGTAIKVLSTLRKAVTLVNLAFLANPIFLVIASIVALIAVGYLVIKNWDSIKEFFKKSWATIKKNTKEDVEKIAQSIRDGFEKAKQWAIGKVKELQDRALQTFTDVRTGIRNRVDLIKQAITNGFNEALNSASRIFSDMYRKITDPIERARSKIKGIVDAIKGFFKNMNLSIPSIKMPKLPRFSITGKLDLLNIPPKIPKLSVQWNESGGYFDRPSVLQGLGENGKEVILPIEHRRHMAPFAQAISENLVGMLGGAGEARQVVEVPVYLNSREIARVMSKDVDRELEKRRATAKRGGRK